MIILLCILSFIMSIVTKQTYAENVCGSVDIGPSNHDAISNLRKCDVVEGSVSIARVNASEWNSSITSQIREITGYLLIYQVHGLKSLKLLFPRLSVIRGSDLFGKYSLVVYENVNLVDLGLISLMNILRGSIRIENNPVLCFVDTINWIRILSNMTTQHYALKKNKNSTECPTCPEVTNNSPTFIPCWNLDNMQRICSECKGGSCNSQGVCCNEMCLSDCVNSTSTFCNICKFFKHTNGECVSTCKHNFVNVFELSGRRCVFGQKCANMNLIAHDGVCVKNCPKDFFERNNRCRLCIPTCIKECSGAVIKTKNDLQAVRGCTLIKGSLIIELNERQTKIISELEDSLSDVEEIEGYLKIVKSPQIVSLYFLKSLKKIRGEELIDRQYSLYVIENYHLEQLWMKNQTVEILSGKIFFHFNPKLCYETISRLLPNIRGIKEFSLTDVSQHSNGARVVCEPNITNLNVTIEDKNSTAVRVKIEPILFDDKRIHLGYFFFYIEAPHQNVSMYDNRHGCGHDDWKLDIDTSKNVRHIINNLKPNTQYAYFVKTFTIATTHIKQDAFSNIQYFRTLSDVPGPIRRFYCYAENETTLALHWWPPSNPQGKVKRYIIKYEPQVVKNIKTVQIKAATKDTTESQLQKTERNCFCGIYPNERRGPVPEEDEFYDRETLIFEDALADLIYIPVTEPQHPPNITKEEETTDSDSEIDDKRAKFYQFLEQESLKEMDTGTKDYPIIKVDNTCEINVEFSSSNDFEICWRNYGGIMIDGNLHKLILNNLDPGTLYKISIRACNQNVAKCSVETIIEGRTLESTYFPEK